MHSIFKHSARFVPALACAASLLSPSHGRTSDTDGVEVLLVRPATENVPDVQQITIVFNKTMVPLGDYEKLAQDYPIEVKPAVDCKWRWLNGSTLACPLNAPLPMSTAYEIRVPAGLKAHDGSILKNGRTEKFTTLRWQVISRDIRWKNFDLPVHTLIFNQPMNLSSLQSKVTSSCGKVSVAQISNADAKEAGVDASRTYLVTHAKGLGAQKDCDIRIPGDAKASAGPLASELYTYTFQTFPEFRITEVICGNERKAYSGSSPKIEMPSCNPDNGVTVRFNAPTTGTNISGKIKTSPEFGWTPGGAGSPEYYAQYGDEELTSIYLASPLQGASQHTVRFENLKDRFGRPLTAANEIVIKTSDFTPMVQLPDGYGVMEQHGPHQHAFSGVNAKSADLRFYFSRSIGDLKMYNSYSRCRSDRDPTPFIYDSLLKRTPIATHATKNIPFTVPVDLDQIAPQFKSGMFVGRFESAKELSGGDFKAHSVCSNLFTVVTDLGLMAKVGYYGSGIWVHSIKSGKPLSGIKAGLYNEDGPIFEGITNDQGFLAAPGAEKWDAERSQYTAWNGTKRLFVVAQTSDDFSMLPFEEGRKGLDYYEFSNYSASQYYYSDPLRASTNHIIHTITDRPLYQPGQKVNVKLFARHWEPRTYGLRPASEVKVDVNDALGNEIVKQKSLKLSDFGTAEFSFTLEPGAPLGSYSIQASVDQFKTHAGQFDVQVFTLPVFKVEVSTAKDDFQVGESAQFQTAARYHFGGGVPNTKGEFTASFTPGYWRPKAPKWDAYTFENSVDLTVSGYEKPRATSIVQLRQGELTTDKNGDVATPILLPTDQLKSYGTVEFEASFQDDRGKSIAARKSVDVFYSQYQIGLKTPEWAYEAKETMTPEVVVLDRNEKPVSGVNVDLRLVHRTYKTVRRAGTGSYYYYDTRTKDVEIDACSFKSGDGPKGCRLKSKAAGDHYIVAAARDPKGRLTQSALQKYVTGKEYIGWYRENHDRIEVIPERVSYKVGETAKILVKNPFQDIEALVTLERFGVLKQFRKKFTKGAETLSIPIDSPDLAPGFYVSVHLIRGRVSEKLEGGVDLGKPSFKMGLTKLTVEDPDTVLKINAKSDREQYEPQDKTKVSFQVRSPAGAGVSELSVAVVDEKILQLAGSYEGRYRLHDKFYALRPGDVATSQMLSFLIGRRHFGKKGAPAGGDGDDGKNVRKNILPLAYWNPTVRTDPSGAAEVSFALPDNLTTWRVLVVAVDKKHRFGFGSTTFRAAKKVMIEPALPSFLTEGDQLNSRFTVFNRTGEKAEFKSELKTTGVELAPKEPSEKKLTIAHDGKAYFEWPVRAPYGQKQAKFEMKALAAQGTDGIRETIPIYPYASYDTFATYGSTVESKVSEPLQIPAGIRPELGGLDVIVSPTLVSHLDDSFRYLFTYPYSCWEQTMTRAIALGQYVSLKQYLSIPELEKDPKDWAKSLLAEMPRFQYSNGGLAYWKPHDETIDPYLSVYTALGLQWLRTEKIAPPSAAESALFAYVKRLAQGSEPFPRWSSARANNTVLAMAAHVLSEQGEDVVPLVNKLFQERKTLSLFGKSFLWMAASKSAATKGLLETLKKEIYATADLTSGNIQFREDHDNGLVHILHSTTRTNCSLLSAMLIEDPKGKFIEPLVRWVIAGRKANRWNNTQENLYCQNALVRYAKIYEKDTPKFTVSGKAMNRDVKGASFNGFKEKPHSETVPFAESIVGQKSELQLEKKGPGRLYYTARLRIAYKDVRTQPVNAGMQVTRTYFTQNPANRKWEKQGPVVKLKRGQLVKVELKVSIPASRSQVVLDDRLPAGLEPVNTALASNSKAAAAGGESDDSAGQTAWNEDDDWFGFYSNGGFYHREMRLHAVQYFARELERGDFTVSYVAQAVATGTFNGNPALIEEMYAPEVYGKSVPAQFIIEE